MAQGCQKRIAHNEQGRGILIFCFDADERCAAAQKIRVLIFLLQVALVVEARALGFAGGEIRNREKRRFLYKNRNLVGLHPGESGSGKKGAVKIPGDDFLPIV
jgi:hypothetical protein